MKKIILIITLLILNIFLLYKTDHTVSVEKVDLELKYNELGITFLGLDDSNSLVLSLNNINILYIIDYDHFTNLKKELDNLNFKIDFVVMNDNYDIPINVPKKIVDSRLNINNIIFNNGKYISINYNNNTLCINNTNCDYVYYTKNKVKVNDNKVLFFNQNLNVSDSIYKEWVDVYKINKSIYTVLKIKEQYEIIEIIKNI